MMGADVMRAAVAHRANRQMINVQQRGFTLLLTGILNGHPTNKAAAVAVGAPAEHTLKWGLPRVVHTA